MCVAGHSVGEYAAILAAEGMTFAQGLTLVRERAIAMEKASPKNSDGTPNGAMCALLGLDIQSVQDIIQNETLGDDFMCSIANDNCPGQCVISGNREMVEKISGMALEKGAKKRVQLSVSGPFHSAWMHTASASLKEILKNIAIKDLQIPLIANSTATAIYTASDIKEALSKQITGVVRWRESVGTMLALGVNLMFEIGHGRVISGITRRCSSETTIHSIQTADDVKQFAELLS
jgi:[acyl-carrier-protein] S-malonyltransferase